MQAAVSVKTVEGQHWSRRILRSDFVRHGALVFASSIVVNLLNYAFHFIVSRKIGVANYGALSSLLAALAIASVPSNVIALVVTRYVAEFHALQEPEKVRAFRRKVRHFAIALGLIATALTALLSPLIAAFLHINNGVVAVILAGATLGVSFVLPCLRAVLQGVQDFRRFAISTATEALFKALLGALFVSVGWQLNGAIGGYLAGGIVAMVYTWMAISLRAPQNRCEIHIDYARLFKTTGGTAAASALLALLGYVDVVLVKHYFPAHQSGIYGIAALVGRILLFVVGFIPTVLLPKATALATRGESPRRILVEAFAGALLLSGIGLGVLAVVPHIVVTALGGPAFAPAASLALPYGIVMTILGLITIVSMYKLGLHRFDFLVPLGIVSAGEIVAIAVHHSTLMDVIGILLVGHSIGLIAASYNIFKPVAKAAAVQAETAA